MRRIGFLILLLLALGWVVAELPAAPAQIPQTQTSDWRRTRDGWERMSWWRAEATRHRPAIHPLVIGSLQVLVSAMGLIAFSKPEEPKTENLGN